MSGLSVRELTNVTDPSKKVVSEYRDYEGNLIFCAIGKDSDEALDRLLKIQEQNARDYMHLANRHTQQLAELTKLIADYKHIAPCKGEVGKSRVVSGYGIKVLCTYLDGDTEERSVDHFDKKTGLPVFGSIASKKIFARRSDNDLKSEKRLIKALADSIELPSTVRLYNETRVEALQVKSLKAKLVTFYKNG